MIELPVHDRTGAVVGNVTVDEADFGGQVRREVLRQAILMYEAARRVGTASTKTRGQVKYSHRKPWRQKGTGRARAGFRGSPIWRGGGVVFGPHPRDYRFKMPKKAVWRATASAYLAKLQDGEVVVIDRLEAQEPKTREMAATLKNLGIERTCLVAIERHDANVWKSARNIPGISVKPVAEINAHDLVRHRQLLITRPALEALVATMRRRFAKPQAVATEGGE